MRITVKCKTENFKNLKYWKLKRERESKGWKSSCKVYRVYTEATYLIDGYGFVGLDGKRLVWRKWIRPVVSLIWSRVQFQLNIMFKNMRLFGKLAGFLFKRLLLLLFIDIQLTFFANFTGTFLLCMNSLCFELRTANSKFKSFIWNILVNSCEIYLDVYRCGTISFLFGRSYLTSSHLFFMPCRRTLNTRINFKIFKLPLNGRAHSIVLPYNINIM